MSNNSRTNNTFNGPVDTTGASFGNDSPIVNNWGDDNGGGAGGGSDGPGPDDIDMRGRSFGSGTVTGTPPGGGGGGGSSKASSRHADESVWDMNDSIKRTVEDRNALAADLIARAKAAAEDQVTSPRYADLMLRAAEKVGHASELLSELPGIHRTDNERDYRHEDARTGERNADISAATDL